jgi:hypothetical protein
MRFYRHLRRLLRRAPEKGETKCTRLHRREDRLILSKEQVNQFTKFTGGLHLLRKNKEVNYEQNRHANQKT